jgi:hypothetical protein
MGIILTPGGGEERAGYQQSDISDLEARLKSET